MYQPLLFLLCKYRPPLHLFLLLTLCHCCCMQVIVLCDNGAQTIIWQASDAFGQQCPELQYAFWGTLWAYRYQNISDLLLYFFSPQTVASCMLSLSVKKNQNWFMSLTQKFYYFVWKNFSFIQFGVRNDAAFLLLGKSMLVLSILLIFGVAILSGPQ